MSDTIIITEEAEGTVISTTYAADGIFSTEDADVDLLLTEGSTVIIVTPIAGSATVVNELLQGPQGIPGDESGGQVRYPVAYAMSGHRIVVINTDGNAIYASKDILSHANKILGMTIEAKISGEILIQTSGIVEEPSWNWVLDTPIWLDVNGLMSQSIPSSGFSLIIGFPISSTSMFIDIREPIFLI